MAPIVLSMDPKQYVGDTATAHDDHRQFRAIESRDLVRPSQNARLMPKLNYYTRMKDTRSISVQEVWEGVDNFDTDSICTASYRYGLFSLQTAAF